MTETDWDKVWVKVEHATKQFFTKKGTVTALEDVNLEVHDGEFVCLLGPSGCGKTTLLRILGGFLDADEGKVIFDGEEISNKPPYERELNTVFQKYALFPHLSVYENIAFGLKIKKMSKDVIDQKVMKMLKLIGLEGYENKNTTLLSGGQQQRVAIARALAMEPEVLLFDEPTSALDPVGRKEILDILLAVRKQTTVLFSTHILSDVERICTDVALLGEGNISIEGKLSDIKTGYRRDEYTILTESRSDSEILCDTFSGITCDDQGILHFSESSHAHVEILRFICDRNISILKIERTEPTLESLFMEVIDK